ncbi:Serine/threonine-protein kinase [Ceratobasidium sp. AG-Ba]|nr:Serine/threonine-protein kinase [Ceratobasidium sp. AG-Ba]
MLSVVIHLCLVLAVLCAATESFRPSTHASIRKFSKELGAARRPHSTHERWRERPPMRPRQVVGEDVRLADIVLAASIDGHFHALNRTDGELLWSMTDDLAYTQSPRDPNTESAPAISSQSLLYNLVRSDHRSLVDPALAHDYDDDRETYIVEPQTGDIFVLVPDSEGERDREMAVERLGYSVPQLVELSPFKPPGDHERVFIGKKTTSLISLDLLTGRILSVYGERCAWDHEEAEMEGPVDVDALLDDLDGTREMPKKQRPVEVVIGRTDYHVSVRMNGKVVQELSYTKYGPDGVHRALQAAWTRSPDSTYFQPSPDNKLYTFANGQLKRYENTYPLVVAVFDAVILPGKRNPILLLQPTPKLSDLSAAWTANSMDIPSVTYVGRIDDSLFALGHVNYPLVIFTPPDKRGNVPRIDDGGKTIPGPAGDKCDGLDCYVGLRRSMPAARSSLSRLITDGEDHDIAVYEPDVPSTYVNEVSHSQSRSRSQTKTSIGTVEPTRTTTHNSSEHSVPSSIPGREEDKVPEATPSHRTVLARLAGEWIAAWAGAGTVLLSTLVFGFGLVSKSKSVKEIKEDGARTPVPDEKLEDVEDDTPPPVPPKPAHYSLSKLTGNPYAITVDSRPAPPPKDPQELKVKRIRPRARAGLPSSASVPVLPAGNPGMLAETNGTSSAMEIARMITDEPLAEPIAIPVEPTEMTTAAEETELETTGKKRVRRGRRGGKGRDKNRSKSGDIGSGADETAQPTITSAISEGAGSETFVKVDRPDTLVVEKAVVTPALSSLVVTEDVLGYGSHGTVVYKGRFQGRSVAVKRLLHDFVTLASREVALLQESDDHPNVIRYYYEERRDNFLYIALELCPCSLADLVERPNMFPEVSASFDPKRALGQVTAGLRHLHALKIVHRDIKPQNILVSARGAMLISDFGLCRKLEMDQTSFLPTAYGNMAAGTAGWRAPEILSGEVKLDKPELDVSSGGVGSGSGTLQPGTRLTRSVDVFALGCLFYYVLTNGEHPYGTRYERDGNIMADRKMLGGLEQFGEEGVEAIDLIGKMLSAEPKARPDTTGCLMHPYFWTPGRRLAFLQDASDRFEIMERDPREPGLVALETDAVTIVGTDWQRKLDKMFIDNLGKFRKYDVKSVQDLLRALRNKKNHYQDLPDNVKRHLGPLPEGFLSYFTKRYPKLFLHVYGVIENSALRTESMFRSYFTLEE